MKILIVDHVHPSLPENLRKEGFVCDEEYDISYNKALHIIKKYDGLVIRSRFIVDIRMIDAASSLKFIARAGSGMENINVVHAYNKGIVCISSPEGNAGPVGEHALGMILSLLHNISVSHTEVSNGIWKRKENQTTELSGLTVGLIGYGHTGPAFAEKLAGMGVNVLAYDKYREKIPRDFARQATLLQIKKSADILSLHVPLTDETMHLVNDDLISSFKKQFYLINTSRGDCVDTAALVRGLRSGKVKGACLDVNEFEHQSLNKLDVDRLNSNWEYLTKARNVILTPHIAGQSANSMKRHAEILVKKILRVIKK